MGPEIPEPLLERVRAVCLAVPDATEEPAWTGIRWKVRGKTFAHLLVVAEGKPPAFAKAAGSDGPIVVLVVRSDTPPPKRPGFFQAIWGRKIVGLIVKPSTSSAQLKALVATRALRASGAAGSAAAPRRVPRAPRR